MLYNILYALAYVAHRWVEEGVGERKRGESVGALAATHIANSEWACNLGRYTLAHSPVALVKLMGLM